MQPQNVWVHNVKWCWLKNKCDAFLFPPFSNGRKDRGPISTGTETKLKIERFAKQMFEFLNVSTTIPIRNDWISHLNIT